MTPAIEILPAAQRAFWEEEKRIPANFVLYGGTAVALRLGHRSSIDFDFFSSSPVSVPELEATLPFARDAQILRSESNTVTLRIDRGGPVTLSFFGNLSFGQLAAPDESGGIKIASLADLMATKLKAVFQRSEAKDYFDIAAMIEAGVSLASGLGGAVALFGPNFNPTLSLKALSYFGDGDLKTVPDEVRAGLMAAVKETRELPARELHAPTIGDMTE